MKRIRCVNLCPLWTRTRARSSGDRIERTEERAPGFLVDFAPDGRPLGIEILQTAPAKVLAGLNAVIAGLSLPPIAESEVRPLLAA